MASGSSGRGSGGGGVSGSAAGELHPGGDEGRLRVEWRPETAEVLAHRPHDGGEWMELVLRAPYVAGRARPGHFVELAVHPAGHVGWDPFLRRAFSLCVIQPAEGVVVVVYRPMGRGTRALQQLQPGARVELLGPLGRSFPDPVRPGYPPTARLVLVGGGIGTPPLVAAAAWARAAGRAVVALIGARTRSELAALPMLQETGVPVTVSTDDGSAGEQGLVTALLARRLADRQVDEVWACGPEAMLVEVKAQCAGAGVPAYLSVERPMACGFGMCMGCSIPRADGNGYLHVCVDGPVLRAEEVRLDGEPVPSPFPTAAR